MTTVEARVAGLDSDRLLHVLLETTAVTLKPCQTGEAKLWTSDSRTDHERAAVRCAGCPVQVFQLCRGYVDSLTDAELRGVGAVFGGRVPRQTKTCRACDHSSVAHAGPDGWCRHADDGAGGGCGCVYGYVA